jgi:hypothetical protein
VPSEAYEYEFVEPLSFDEIFKIDLPDWAAKIGVTAAPDDDPVEVLERLRHSWGFSASA